MRSCRSRHWCTSLQLHRKGSFPGLSVPGDTSSPVFLDVYVSKALRSGFARPSSLSPTLSKTS
jgi:hypothetical protein